MTYKDYYLKFPDEKTQKLFYDPENEIYAEGFNVRIIGHICDNGAHVVDSEGFEYCEQVPREGWFVNLRSKQDLPDELKQYQVFPKTPEDVWL